MYIVLNTGNSPIIYHNNNKQSRLDACPSTMRKGKNFNTHF